jgi:hypothetical protein
MQIVDSRWGEFEFLGHRQIGASRAIQSRKSCGFRGSDVTALRRARVSLAQFVQFLPTLSSSVEQITYSHSETPLGDVDADNVGDAIEVTIGGA